jgi:hypothetical protein
MPKDYSKPGLSGRMPDKGSSVESSGNKPSRPPRTHTYKSGPTKKIGEGTTAGRVIGNGAQTGENLEG